MNLLFVTAVILCAAQIPLVASASVAVGYAVRLIASAFGCRRGDRESEVDEPDVRTFSGVVPLVIHTTTISPITTQPRDVTVRMTMVPTLKLEERREKLHQLLLIALQAVNLCDLAAIRTVAPFRSVSVGDIALSASAVLAQQDVDPAEFRGLVDRAVCAYESDHIFGLEGVDEQFLDLMKVIYMMFQTYQLSASEPEAAYLCLRKGLGFLKDLKTKHYEGPIVF